MDPIQEYQNALNTPLTQGNTSPTTVVTPKLARTAINSVRQGVQAVNTMQGIHRANLAVQNQVNQQNQQAMDQQNYQKQQDEKKRQMDMYDRQQKQQNDQANNQIKELGLILQNLKEPTNG